MKWLAVYLIGFVVGLLLLLSACSAVNTIATKGAEISDTALTNAEWMMCKGASVGSVKRRYGVTLERANLYREFCDGSGEANVIAP